MSTWYIHHWFPLNQSEASITTVLTNERAGLLPGAVAGVEDDLGASVVQAGVVPSDLPGPGPEEVLVASCGENTVRELLSGRKERD